MHCPWDVIDFGGYSPYFDLLSAVPAGVRAGRCFPARSSPRAPGCWRSRCCGIRSASCAAWLVGIAALALRFGLGWVQQMRGAHFLSHTLWSLWISWAVVLLCTPPAVHGVNTCSSRDLAAPTAEYRR